MTRPSGISSHCPPSPLISALSAASRSVSWPRRWAIPVQLRHRTRRGERGQRRNRTAPVRRRRAGRRRSRRRLATPCTSRYESAVPDNGTQLLEDAEDGVGGLRAGRWPARDAHDPAARDRGREERHRVGQVGLDHPVPCGDLGRATPASGWPGCRRRRTPASRSIATVIATCGAEGTDSPVCTIVSPSVNARTGQQQPRDELRRPRGVDLDGAAGDRSGAAHRERQAVTVDVDAEPAQCVEQRRDRTGAGLFVAVEHDGLGGQRRDRRHESQHGARQAAVDGGTGGRVDVAADRQLGVVAVDADAEGAQRTDHQIGVPAAQRAADRRRALGGGQRGEHERPVGLRLRAGHRHRGVHRARRRRRLPVRHGSILPCRRVLPPWDVCAGDSR